MDNPDTIINGFLEEKPKGLAGAVEMITKQIMPEDIEKNGKFTEMYSQMMDIYKSATNGKNSDFSKDYMAQLLPILAKQGTVIGAFDSNLNLIGYGVGIPGAVPGFCEKDMEMEDIFKEINFANPVYLFGCELAVKPEEQHKGAGSEIVKHFLNNCYNLTFTFDITNPKTAHFYVQKLGAAVTKYSKDAYGDSNGRAVHSGGLFERENRGTFAAFRKKENIEEIADEPILEAENMKHLYSDLKDKKPAVFNLKIGKADKDELNSFLNYAINDLSYMLTDVVRDSGNFFYRFQSPESITDWHLQILTQEKKQYATA